MANGATSCAAPAAAARHGPSWVEPPWAEHPGLNTPLYLAMVGPTSSSTRVSLSGFSR